MKRCPTPAMRDVHIITTESKHVTPNTVAVMKKTVASVGKDSAKLGPSDIAERTVKRSSCMGRVCQFLRV